jgi:hypothetical protein
VVAPEGDAVLDALREMNVPDYARALADLTAARRQHRDQHRLLELTSRLRESAPDLAATWQDASAPAFTSGTARFVPLPELLAGLPAADTADLVMLLDSDQLEAANLLVTASAPRLLAVGAGFGRAGIPDYASGFSGRGETVVSVLRRAGVPIVLGGDSAAETVRGKGVATRAESGTRAVASSGAHAASGGAHALSTHVQAARDTGGSDGPASEAAADTTEPTDAEKVAAPAATEPGDAAAESATPEPSKPAPAQPPAADIGRRPLTEEEAAFMVMPLGIVPRQADRPAIEQMQSEPENLAESEQRDR